MNDVKKYKAQEKYDAANTVRVNVKLNKKTDADILEFLEDKNKLGTIKAAIRMYMEHEKENW